MVGLNSPFGTIGQIREKTGYSLDYMLWGEPWINYILESADAPRYEDKPQQPLTELESEDDIRSVLGSNVKII